MKKLIIFLLTILIFFSISYGDFGEGVLKAEDAILWEPVNNGLYGGYIIRSLIIDPENSQIIYAGTYGGGIFKSTNGGLSWSEVNSELTNLFIYSLAIDPKNTRVLYAGTTGGRVFKTTNGGLSWSEINLGLTNLPINDIVIDQKNTQIIYVGTWGGGIYKSTNGGLSWLEINEGLNNLSISYLTIDQVNTLVLYVGTNGGGIFKSTNGGLSWLEINTGLKNLNISSIFIDPTNSQVVYLGTYGGGVFKTTNGGFSWTEINTELTNLNINSLIIDPKNTQIIYVGTNGGGVFRSTNGGSSWSEINGGLANLWIRTLTIDPANTQVIYAGTYDGGVFKSINGGLSWSEINFGLKNLNIYSLAIDLTNTQTIYAGSEGGGVFKSKLIQIYTVTFDSNSGTQVSSQKIASGEKIIKPNDPTKVGYTFAGWYKDSDYTIKWDFDKDVVTQDITLYAKWIINSYTIIASVVSGGIITPSGKVTVYYGETKTFNITPDKGYKIKDVLVDGKSVGAISTYTFENIDKDHTIEVIFEKGIEKIILKLQIGSKIIYINDTPQEIDVSPQIIEGRTLLPIRWIAEPLGATISWDGSEKKVIVTLKNITIELWIGKNIAKVNGVETPIDPGNPRVVPMIISGRTMLPIRFVAENLGCDVQWDSSTKTITIIYPKH